jgi:mono/diheme cytochrome c family protein
VRRRALVAGALALALAQAGCQDAPVAGSQVLGGETIPAAVLERGAEVYLRHCAPCHGEHGDGRGPAARGMWPPPRDFTTAQFKFAGVIERGLPADPELQRIVAGGLAGSAMRPWPLPGPDLTAVVHHLKTFSPPGAGFRDPSRQATAPELPPDPIAAGERAAAIAEGERLYHAVFQCSACHPAYVGAERMAAWDVAPRGEAPDAPAPRWSPAFRTVLVPTDFLRHPMRAVRDRDPGPGLDLEPADLYRAIAYGLGGPMPGYGHLGAREIWQVVHYVKSLADRREALAP